MMIRNVLILSLIAIVGFSSCKKEETPEEKKAKLEARFTEAAENYANIVRASYDDCYDEVKKLKSEIEAFVQSPSEAGFKSCKKQWLAARIPYGQTEIYRFYAGPIDNEEDGPEGLINAWPIDESFVDYVQGRPDAGFINDPAKYPTISKKVLEDLNESISETSIFTGYHAIEFLLWGQDLYSDGPGRRPYTDYITGSGGTSENQARRGKYLITVTDLLLDHLDKVRSQWGANGSYQKKFLAESNKDIITKIWTSFKEMAKGELGGERMNVAVKSKDQEDEHSCFSDNTHVDILQNYQGIVNVYTGTYTRPNGKKISGESYDAIAKDLDPEKAKAVTDAIAEARKAIDAIPVPFDNAIINNSEKILSAVERLANMSNKIADIKVVFDQN